MRMGTKYINIVSLLNTIILSLFTTMFYAAKTGKHEGNFQLDYPVNVGTWHIIVEAFVSFVRPIQDLS